MLRKQGQKLLLRSLAILRSPRPEVGNCQTLVVLQNSPRVVSGLFRNECPNQLDFAILAVVSNYPALQDRHRHERHERGEKYEDVVDPANGSASSTPWLSARPLALRASDSAGRGSSPTRARPLHRPARVLEPNDYGADLICFLGSIRRRRRGFFEKSQINAKVHRHGFPVKSVLRIRINSTKFREIWSNLAYKNSAKFWQCCEILSRINKKTAIFNEKN